MGLKSWIGGAPAVAQVDTLTVGGTPAVSQVYTVTIGSASVSYTALGSDTNATIATALQALLAASSFGQFQDCSWTVSGAVITATAVLAGQPFIVSGSASGTGSLAVATVTANAGPNDISVASNYDAGAVPVTGDTLYVSGTGYDLLYNLQALAGVTLAARAISSTFQPGPNGNATIGLPGTNTMGASPYQEYRQRYWQCGVTNDAIGYGTGACSDFILLDYGAVQTSCAVNATGTSSTQGEAALQIKGTNAANIISVVSGEVAIAPNGDDLSTVATLYIGSQTGGSPTVTSGANATITNCTMVSGTATFGSGPTTIKKTGGNASILGGNLTSVTDLGGTTAYLGDGTIGALVVGASAVADFSQSIQSRTVTNTTLLAGATLLDPSQTVTWTNPITLSQCGIADVSIDFGRNITLAPVYL